MTYKLLTYRMQDDEQAGVLIGGSLFPLIQLTRDPRHRTVLGALEGWAEVAQMNALAGDPPRTGGIELEEVLLCAPIPAPPTIYCAAANYSDHIANVAKRLGMPLENPREGGLQPYHFLKPPRSTVVSPGHPIRYPSFAEKLDWEVELVAVIGRKARQVAVADALGHVAGYTIANDISVRDMDYVRRPNVPATSPFRTDFISMKGFDDSCPLGPYIVPANFLSEPQNLHMRCWVDGELMQDGNTSNMVFSVAEQISYLSQRVTLQPGDIVLTGTPAGTGVETGRFLSPGQTVRVEIEGIGSMENQIAPSEEKNV